MDAHLDPSQRRGGNKRNGKGSKIIKSSAGSFQIDTPQDRQSSFDPQLIRKRETVLAGSYQKRSINNLTECDQQIV
jgi:transposase-like protein